MPKSHSSVVYVEPNYTSNRLSDIVNDGKKYDRAPDLEDYCIAMDIEVMLSSREKSVDIKDGNNRCIIMSFRSDNEGKSNIRFMSGTRVGGYKITDDGEYEGRLSGYQPNVMTSYYADLYVTDLIDYGTTEMLGIKSVDVEYNSTCVPVITVKFTDVRGMSLFHPSEFNHSNSFNGINGFSKDNIVQSFFQAFFTLPLPVFTVHLKGFYGNPVSYQVMCDKFDSAFDSKSGCFDVTVRFVGFAYSFMADVSMNALLAAPYSDYEGEAYWNTQVDSGNWTLTGKYGEPCKMLRLYDIRKEYESARIESDEKLKPSVEDVEETNHDAEIESLTEIVRRYDAWYENLFGILSKNYNTNKGKEFCYWMKSKDGGSPYRRIILLTTEEGKSLTEKFEGWGDDFKKTNDELIEVVERYNNSFSSFRKLDAPKKNFDYKSEELFNPLSLAFDAFNKVTNYQFKGISDKTTIPREEWDEVKTLINYKDNNHRFAYIIQLKYDDVKERITKLESDKKNHDEDIKEKERQLNDRMYEKLGFYPSVENFTKVVMAHLETLMHMLFKVQEDTKNRTLANLKLPNGDILSDIPNPETRVNAFPRITKRIDDNDGYTKKEDAWVGDYNNGDGFREVDVINGLFNGAEQIAKIEEAIEIANMLKNEESGGKISPEAVTVLYLPITSYDFVMTKNPYGDSDFASGINAFAGKVAMRMMGVLSLNLFYQEETLGKDAAGRLGKIEAHNFNKLNRSSMTDVKVLQAIGENGEVSTSDKILDIVTGKATGTIPWETGDNESKILISGNDKLWITRYRSGKEESIQPLQNMSFKTLNDNNIDGIKKSNNEDVFLSSDFSTGFNYNKIISDHNINNKIFNTFHITEKFNQIEQILQIALSDSNVGDDYKKEVGGMLYNFLNTIKNDLNSSKRKIFNSYNKEFSIGKRIDEETYKKISTGRTKHNLMYAQDERVITESLININNDKDTFLTESLARNIQSFTLVQVFGYTDNKIDDEKSLFMMPEFYEKSGYVGDDCQIPIVGGTINAQAAKFLFGVNAFDFDDAIVIKERPFSFLPKLTVLQIGAALAMYHTFYPLTTSFSVINYKVGHPVGSMENKNYFLPAIPESLGKFLGTGAIISVPQKLSLIKYFREWVYGNQTRIKELFLDNVDNYGSEQKKVSNSNYIYCYSAGNKGFTESYFNQDSETIKFLSNDLFSMVFCMRLVPQEPPKAIWDKAGEFFKVRSKKGYDEIMAEKHGIDKTVAKAYLDSFLNELRGLLSLPGYKADPTTMANEPQKTTKAMKIELYRYLKQVYDKWVCSTQEDNWKMQKFFESPNAGNPVGNNFYFIDSFFNKIGNKLLINLDSISKRLKLTTSAMDTNVMMYNFLVEVLGDHRCMLKCVQNFGLTYKNFDTVFKPIPYSQMSWAKSLPDFVIIYAYEPSRNLAVANAEYKDDGFMLNDDNDIPLPIKSRSNEDKYYKIPAFGVSYGRQYQSYFKSVNVDMSHPALTEQAIISKHAILTAARHKEYKGTRAQDAYDIYSNQSYTCTVEMMGCAYIQPLMYFVLLNVPFFKGSYLIQKVRHSMIPGDMTTTITGVRMSKYCNNMVTDIFSGEDSYGGYGSGSDTRKYLVASNDNDCPYKVFTVFPESANLTEKQKLDGKNIMDKIARIMYGKQNAGESNGVKIAAAAIVGNMMQECRLKHTTCTGDTDGYPAGGLCGWNDRYYNLTNLIAGNTSNYGSKENPTKKTNYEYYSSQLKTLNVFSDATHNYDPIDNQIVFLDRTLHQVSPKCTKEMLSAFTDVNSATEAFRAAYEKGENPNGNREKFANAFYEFYNNTDNSAKNAEKSLNEKLPHLLFVAIQKSVDSSPKINVKLKEEISKSLSIKGLLTNNSTNVLTIAQENGKNDKMALVFDIILNSSEYYQYVSQLRWKCNDVSDANPSSIEVKVSLNVEENHKSRKVYIGDKDSNKFTDDSFKETSPVSEGFLKSIVKKYILNKNIFDKECPQFASVDSIFEKYKPQSCISVMNETYGSGAGTGSGKWGLGGKDRTQKLKAWGYSDYPSEQECGSRTKAVTVKIWNANHKDSWVSGTTTLTVHERVAQEVIDIFDDIFVAKWPIGTKPYKKTGQHILKVYPGLFYSYSYRPVAGTSTLSYHAFGLAIDINFGDKNKGLNNYDTSCNGTKGKVLCKQRYNDEMNNEITIRTANHPVVKIFEKYGWGWGGTYGDFMHFSKFGGG